MFARAAQVHVSRPQKLFLVIFQDVYVRTFFILILVAPSLGRVRTAISFREATVLARFRPGSGGQFNIDFHCDRKCSWV